MATQIDYAITTVERPHNYIHKLLSRIATQNPIRLVVGGPKIGYLQRYQGNPQLQIVQVSPETDARHFQRCVHHRSIWNYWRTLTIGPSGPDREGLLVMEDDIVPAVGWERRFHETLDQVVAVYGTKFVLALYTPYYLPPETHAALYTPYPIQQFFGTQAIYYPGAIRKDFSEFLAYYGVELNAAPYDVLLKSFLDERGIPLLTTFPSLFQHIGKRSTGLADFRHRAAYFQKYLYPGKNPAKHLDTCFRKVHSTTCRVLSDSYQRLARFTERIDEPLSRQEAPPIQTNSSVPK